MKKGFTLVELLGVIILLGVVGLIVVPSITKLLKDSRQDLYENQVKMIEESARKWGIQNTEKLSETRRTYLSVSDLVDEGFIEQDSVKDPRTNEDMNGCIVIRFENSSSKFKYQYIDDSCEEAYEGTNLTSEDPEYVCYNFDEETGTIINYDKSNPICSGDVIIPDNINGVAVRHIGKAAFYQPQEQWCYNYIDLPIGLFYLQTVMGPYSYSEFSEEEIFETVMGIEEAYENYDVYSMLNGYGYDQVLTSYNHTESDGYDGCYYYGVVGGNKISSITIPPFVQTIGDYAFMSNSIEELDLSDASSLQSIGEFAFADNELQSINFGASSSLTEIESGAFADNKLSTVNLSGLTSLTTLGNTVVVRHLSTSYFNDDFEDSELMYYFFGEYPNAMVHDLPVGLGVFENNLISSINLSNLDSLTTIGDYTFTNNRFTNVNLSTLTSLNIIGRFAFANNDISQINFTGLASLQEIRNGAFAYNNLTNVNLTPLTGLVNLGTIEDNFLPGVFGADPYEQEFLPLYLFLEYGVFESNNISTVSLPNTTSLETIGYGVFQKNYLESIDLTNFINLTEIGPFSFSFNWLESIDISGLSYLEKINFYAFGFNSIQSLDFTGLTNLRFIAAGAFGINALTSLNLQGLTNLMAIGGYAFGDNNITSVNFTGLTNLEIIDYGAFEDNSISSITIPASVTTIGEYAFYQGCECQWVSVTIEFNQTNPITRFNEYWEEIGWPSNLMPGA